MTQITVITYNGEAQINSRETSARAQNWFTKTSCLARIHLLHQGEQIACNMDSQLQLFPRKPQIRELMLGGAGIAGMFHVVPHDQAVQTLQKAVELGITQFDTAPVCL